MTLKGMFESFTFRSLSIIPILKQALQHLCYRTGYKREWPMCCACNKRYFKQIISTES
jgi:hypothetical protein